MTPTDFDSLSTWCMLSGTVVIFSSMSLRKVLLKSGKPEEPFLNGEGVEGDLILPGANNSDLSWSNNFSQLPNCCSQQPSANKSGQDSVQE